MVIECHVKECSYYDNKKSNQHHCQIGYDNPIGCKVYRFATGEGDQSFSSDDIKHCKKKLKRKNTQEA